MGKLDGKSAIITGAAMGNGEGMARVLARHGAKIALWDISEKVHSTCESILSEGHTAAAYQVDVTKFEECKEAAAAVISDFERVDILCNNAGVARLVRFLDMSDELRDFHFAVNVNGVWNCTKAVLPHMVRNKSGRIINMSSVTGPMVVDEGETAYAATKAAVWGFTKALAREVANDGITVNAICPGYIHTPMVEQAARDSNPSDPEQVITGIAQGVPMGRLGTIMEIGELAAFLASNESTYITGTQIVIDGGSTLPETTTMKPQRVSTGHVAG